MKRYIASLSLLLLAISICVASDHIIFRTGQGSDVKLLQINDEKIVFCYTGDKSNAYHEVPSKDVFMVYVEKQGNVYITSDGKRFTGETKRADPKRNHAIYLKKGVEIAADEIKITENEIRYSIKVKNDGISGLIGKGDVSEAVIDKSEVFMIRYRSGLIDIINPLLTPEKNELDATANSTGL